jgi:hypothetical protein
MPIVLTVASSLLLTLLASVAEIRGIVVDISGAPVPEATVVRIVDGRGMPYCSAMTGRL